MQRRAIEAVVQQVQLPQIRIRTQRAQVLCPCDFATRRCFCSLIHVSSDATQSMERGGGRITEQLLKKGLVTQGNATKSIERGGGRFAEHLLKKGLITQDMLKKLHKEWDRNGSNNAVTTDEERLAKKGKKGSRRKK